MKQEAFLLLTSCVVASEDVSCNIGEKLTEITEQVAKSISDGNDVSSNVGDKPSVVSENVADSVPASDTVVRTFWTSPRLPSTSFSAALFAFIVVVVYGFVKSTELREESMLVHAISISFSFFLLAFFYWQVVLHLVTMWQCRNNLSGEVEAEEKEVEKGQEEKVNEEEEEEEVETVEVGQEENEEEEDEDYFDLFE